MISTQTEAAMSSTAVSVRHTPEQYLALERAAAFKSEYIDGVIYPMSGVSRLHNLIAGNLYRVVSTWLLDRPGEVYVSEMRVHVGPAGLYTYPDVAALPGEAQLEDTEFDTLLNPSFIAEVLSPSTEAYDRGEKFERYKRLESLREYVLLAQDRVHVERHSRRGEQWELAEFSGLDDVLRLDSIDCDVPIRQIYAKTPLVD
jgi:Uma2 family endonuclease